MGTRILTLLIFFIAVNAYACLSCHQPHYAETGTCVSCHRGSMETSRINIAHNGLLTSSYAGFYTDETGVESGGEIVASSACRRCHVAGGEGENAAVSLDSSAGGNTGEYLADKIKNVNDYMPDFRFSDSDITKIVKYLLFQSTKQQKSETEPLVIYIKPPAEGVFEKSCGDCHKLLTRKGGGKGTGDIARNLSGLFSRYFVPSVLPEGEIWTEEKLLKWIKNPRSIKKGAFMPPVIINEKEQKKLISEFLL